MTAAIIQINHELSEFVFHCPLTGTPVVGDVEQSFEGFASPYFLFCITETGAVYSRKDALAEPIASVLGKVVDELSHAGGMDPRGVSAFELGTFMPNVIAGMLPESSVIFDIRGANQHDESSPRTWVVMNFTLPARAVDETCIGHSADLVPIE